jgi:hypothetical protein
LTPKAEQILMSSPIFKFNDYKKKQERNILITNARVYNCKDTSNCCPIQPSRERLRSTKSRPLLSAASEQNLSSTFPMSTTTGKGSPKQLRVLRPTRFHHLQHPPRLQGNLWDEVTRLLPRRTQPSSLRDDQGREEERGEQRR